MELRSSKVGLEVLDLKRAAIGREASPPAHLHSLISAIILERKKI